SIFGKFFYHNVVAVVNGCRRFFCGFSVQTDHSALYHLFGFGARYPVHRGKISVKPHCFREFTAASKLSSVKPFICISWLKEACVSFEPSAAFIIIRGTAMPFAI